MQSAEILRKLRDANLPVPAIDLTTLVVSGFPELRRMVENKEYKPDTGLRSYSLVGQGKLSSTLTRTALACALMGKELALSGVKVRYTGLAGLLRWSGDHFFDDENPYVSGDGYIVIPDFDDEVVIEGRPHQWRDSLEMLGRHLSHGGGVIIGKGQSEIDFMGSYFELLYREFVQHPIHPAKK